MRLLLVEDDKTIADLVAKGFRQAGFLVDWAKDGEEGLSLAVAGGHQAAVVDLMLPKLEGLSMIEKLRGQKISLPVLILSAKDSVNDRIKGLQSGGDDYLVKPFSFAELLARVQALIRRDARVPEATHLAVGDLALDLLSREARRGGQRIELQAREYALLEYLMRNAGRVVSKTMLLEKIWDYDFDPQTNVVDVLVCRLRNKVDKGFDQKMIQTLRGLGYVLKSPA